MFKRNLIANFIGQGWTSLIGLAFVPIYIHYLGVEGYALIALFGILQATFVLVDSGLSPAIVRETAQSRVGMRATSYFPAALRYFEFLYIIISLFFLIVIAFGANWIAREWLQPNSFSVEIVHECILWMGLAVGLLALESLYRAILIGAARQELLNMLLALSTTIRAVGALVVLAFGSADIVLFFAWQAIACAISVTTFLFVARGILKDIPSVSIRPSGYFKSVWYFSSGSLATTALALALTQTDKILLSRLLPLETFGYYTVATTLVAAIYQFVKPITQACYPKLTELVVAGQVSDLIALYHRCAQICALAILPIGSLLIFFADPILLLWTRNATIAANAAPLLVWLSVGTILNGLMSIPYILQLAYGWTHFSAKANVIALAFLFPAIIWSVPLYGAEGAAICWVLLNAGYIIISAPLMHRHLLKGETRRWLIRDVLSPFTSAMLVGYALQTTFPGYWNSMISASITITASVLLSVFAVLVVMPELRKTLLGIFLPQIQTRN